MDLKAFWSTSTINIDMLLILLLCYVLAFHKISTISSICRRHNHDGDIHISEDIQAARTPDLNSDAPRTRCKCSGDKVFLGARVDSS
jgi:hypothetical protein